MRHDYSDYGSISMIIYSDHDDHVLITLIIYSDYGDYVLITLISIPYIPICVLPGTLLHEV